ncbi:uncharacterized protein LOC109840799 [Asparagus officinalis]|uniref:uncharacterized protein LOC109840799 n=1 Tax=Asparagus officinalis TaxID=4686 RepID=UPI00098E8364|nr:uncharacterized protein LOC109840799 [Asparagus officinalis]
MALNFAPSSSLSTASLRFQIGKGIATKNHSSVLIKPATSEKYIYHCKAAAQSEGVAEEESNSTGSSARTQLDLLEQLTSSTSSTSGYESDGYTPRSTIREQLSELIRDRDGEFILPLGKKLKASLNSLTISQKRNIKRQAYLNEVSRRNDSVFFATIGAFVILPPVIILSVAILTGYVQLFP